MKSIRVPLLVWGLIRLQGSHPVQSPATESRKVLGALKVALTALRHTHRLPPSTNRHASSKTLKTESCFKSDKLQKLRVTLINARFAMSSAILTEFPQA